MISKYEVIVVGAAMALAAFSASAQTAFPRATTDSGYLTQEWLDRVGPPIGFLSLQHFYAIMKRCEVVDPVAERISLRAASFEQLIENGKSNNGLWRTFADRDGRVKETHFNSARAMVSSPEFLADVKRYERTVAATLDRAMLNDCAEFVNLVKAGIERN